MRVLRGCVYVCMFCTRDANGCQPNHSAFSKYNQNQQRARVTAVERFTMANGGVRMPGYTGGSRQLRTVLIAKC